MFVDLTTSIHGKHEKRLLLAVGTEQNPPAAYARFADACAFGERRRESGIEGILGQLDDPCAEAFLGWPVQPVESLFGFVSNDDAIAHNPRSRSY